MASLRIALGSAWVLAWVGVSSPALADCYVDSVAGNDSNNGQTEATAVQSQAPISGCGTVYYKRGSRFNEPVQTSAGSTFTNYGTASDPLPAFVTTDTVVNSFQGGITIDGLHLEGSMGDGSMGGMGVCVMMGGNSQLLNNEITDCDIGIMLFGDNSLVQGNVVYDLDRMAVDSTDPDVYVNSVGGAEGIFVSGSNNELAYNQFINCKAEAAWVGDGGYDGGATEVAVSDGGTVTGLRIHHNYAYNTCGFFEVSGTGTFSDSEFYYNVSVDSAWAMLLQVNETTLSNIRWENNTFVHHADAYMPSIAMIYQADLTPNTVFFNNNLVIFDGANSFMGGLDDAISASNNLIVESDPGVVNIAGTTADAFDLLAGSAAIDQGLTVPGHNLDFLNRTVPDPGGVTDIGAFEYGSSQGAPIPDTAQVPEAGTGEPTESCTEPLSLCDGVCVDLTSDASNCGSCNHACSDEQFCSTGACAAECDANLTQCGQSCVDVSTSILHCGGCNAACQGGQTCEAGICTGTPTSGDITQPIASDGDSGADEDSGCNCSVVGTPNRAGLAGLGLLVALGAPLLLRRRRTKPRR